MAFGLDLGNLLVHLNLDASQYLRTARTIEKRLEATAAKLTSIGTKMSLAITLPLALMGRSAVKTFASLEEGFIGVEKTVNASTEQLSALKSGFEDMSQVMPVAITDLFKIGEAAGQLGIETDKILGFTKVMAELGVTTNLSSDEAATALARFANITNMSQDNFDRLGATIVDLGNNLATTEAEIVTMSLRLAGAGSQIGLSEAQILSLAGALSSVGLRAEQGGTTFSRIMLEMNTAVKSGTESLGIFADVSKLSGEEFSSLFNQDSSKAITTFIEGLVSLRSSGEDLMPIFSGIGLEGTRVMDVMGRLSGRTGLLKEAFKLGNKAWAENIALSNEAEKKFASFNSQMRIVKNSMVLLSADVGEQLVPAVKKISEIIKRVTLWFLALDDSSKKLIVTWGIVAAATGPILLGMGLLIKAILIIKSTMITIIALTSGMLPMIALLSVIALGVYSMSNAWRNNFANMRDVLQSFVGIVSDAWALIIPIFNKAFFYIQKFWKEALNHMGVSLANYAKDVIGVQIGLINVLKNMTLRNFNIVENFAQGFTEAHDVIGKLGDALGNPIIKADEFILKVKEIGDVVKGLSGEAFTDLWDMNLDQAKTDMNSFITWLNTISTKLQPGDPALKIIADLRAQTEGVIKIMEDLPPVVEKVYGEVSNKSRQFTAETIARFAEFQQSLTSIMEQGLMNMVEDWKNWKDTIISMLREVYFEAVRIAFIRPAATAAAEGLTGAGKFILGALNIGTTSAGATSAATSTSGASGLGGLEGGGIPQAADGGSVMKTGWAVIHKGEEFSGVGKTLGGNGNLNFKLHYEGQPLVVSKQQSFIQNEQQFAEVWLAMADTNQAVRSRLKGNA